MVITDKLKRPSLLAVAALLVVASLVPVLRSREKVFAYGLVPQRSIKISSSKAFVSGDPDVTYTVTFTAATTGTVKGVVIDFCAGTSSPIIGDVCTAPSSFTVGTPTVANQAGISGFTAASANTGRTLVLTKVAGSAVTGGTTVISFDITTVKNPDTTGTFYARILTYANSSGASSPATYTATANGTDTTGVVDAGGIALSTANQLTITAKVQERLTFCIYTTGADCASGTGNSIILGDANGVLDNNVEYTNNVARFGVSTNANGYTGNCATDFDPDANPTLCSVVVRMKGGTLKSNPACPDGVTQTCSINPIGGTPTDTAAGTEQFGLCVGFASSQTPLLATQPYDGGNTTPLCDVTNSNSPGGNSTPGVTTNLYAFDDNNTTGTKSPYGQVISTFNAATEKTGILEFVGNIAATTEPGVYTTTLTFIATGTY